MDSQPAGNLAERRAKLKFKSIEKTFFKIFDISERVIYNASPESDIAWSVNNLPIISNLSSTTIDTDIPALHQLNGRITANVYFDGSVDEEDY